MAWYNDAAIYHMYPLGITGAERENPENGPEKERFDILLAYIPYLKELGINAVYIGPLFESSSHGYDTRDYRRIDRRLGTNEDFKKFVYEAHNSGIKVIVDAVFNHTGRDFFAFKDLRERKYDSPYRYWYKGVDFNGSTPYGDPFSYSSWRGNWELAELNFENQDVADYILDTVRFWTEEFSIDGLRLDCADKLSMDFQRKLRIFTRELKEDFFLLGEVIHGEYGRWVNDEMLHSVTDYELHKSLYSAFNSHNFFEASHNMRRNMRILPGLYNFLENHDVDRIASKLENKKNLYPCYMALFTIPGIPSIYYGGEFALEGRKNGPDDSPLRPCIRDLAPNEFTVFIKDLLTIYMKNPELRSGDFNELLLETGFWVYMRRKDNEGIVTLLNNTSDKRSYRLTLRAEKIIDAFTEEELSGDADINIEGNSGRILKLINIF